MAGQVADYHYELPEELIARYPLERRDASRMMVVNRREGTIAHGLFRDLPDYLSPEDLVVLNNSRVIRARTFSEDGKIEVFFVEPLAPGRWLCLVRPGKKMKLGDRCRIGGSEVVVREILPGGERIIETEENFHPDRVGQLPLPPYFHRPAEESDEERYQNVFARTPGSVAAPTAGLHFTPEMLNRVPHAFVTLHVGLGTFQPIKSETIQEHVMHEERFSISSSTARALNTAGSLLAVGTTVVRVLESRPDGPFQECEGRTRIFIHPPYTFRRVGKLLTNFHLPASTLLMLVSAFAGRELVLEAYARAVRERYRFYSYGDCMLLI